MPVQAEILFTTTEIPTCMYAHLHTYMHATIRVQLAKEAFSTGKRAASIQYAEQVDLAAADHAFYQTKFDSEYAPSPPAGRAARRVFCARPSRAAGLS